MLHFRVDDGTLLEGWLILLGFTTLTASLQVDSKAWGVEVRAALVMLLAPLEFMNSIQHDMVSNFYSFRSFILNLKHSTAISVPWS